MKTGMFTSFITVRKEKIKMIEIESNVSKFDDCLSCISQEDVKNLSIGIRDNRKHVIGLCRRCRADLARQLVAELLAEDAN